MDARVRDKICLKLGDVHVQSPIEPQACRQRADDLSDQPVEVRVGRALNVQVPAANVVQRLVVLIASKGSQQTFRPCCDLVCISKIASRAYRKRTRPSMVSFLFHQMLASTQGLLPRHVHDSHIRVLEQRMNAKDSVVWLYHCCCHLWTRPNCEGDLALFTIVHGQALQHQTAQAGSCAAADSIVHAETLQSGAVIGQLADSSVTHAGRPLQTATQQQRESVSFPNAG